MSEKKDVGKTNRRAYRKPHLEKVQLTSEETVLLTCKTSTSVRGAPPCKNKAIGCNKTRTKS
jgi:hypothetical protein